MPCYDKKLESAREQLRLEGKLPARPLPPLARAVA